jgi:integrase
MAEGGYMLKYELDRYISQKRSLGYKFKDTARQLKQFVGFLNSSNERFITSKRSEEWANMGTTPYQREVRMMRVVQFAEYLALEDKRHEVASRELFNHKYVRPIPYIYSNQEIDLILDNLLKLRRHKKSDPFRPEIYATLIALIACTGMRINEALNLKFDDIIEGNILHVRNTKFGKSRYIPLHSSAVIELEKFLNIRRKLATNHDYIFTGQYGNQLTSKAVSWNFLNIIRKLNIGSDRKTSPRVHDLRHTFATKSLEKCSNSRESVNKHFVALSTYLGHVDLKSTYWYLEATPSLMKGLSSKAESFFSSGGLK